MRLRELQRELAARDRGSRALRTGLHAPRANPTPDSRQIVQVLAVVDTRTYEEGPDEKWYPIPGSGNEHECDRCGRVHEVHAEVKLSDGTTAIVGTGCMGSVSLDVASRVKALTSRAKTLARLRGERAATVARQEAFARAEREVDGLPVPPMVRGTAETASGQIPTLMVGDATVWTQFGEDDERRRAAVDHWRDNRLHERGFRGSDGYRLRDQLHDLDRRIARAERAVR